jgi:hypothetical protein
VLLLPALWLSTATARAADHPPATANELFTQTTVWTVSFTFKPDQWDAMDPKGGGNVFSLMFSGGGRTGPGSPAALASAILKRGDLNRDQALDSDEIQKLAIALFDRWDLSAAGFVKTDRIEDGLATLLDPEGLAQSAFPIVLRGAENQRNGLATALGISFKQVDATFELAESRFKSVAVRYKGNGTFLDSRGSLKRSLKVDLNKSVKGQKLAGAAKLNFHNNVADPSAMNESVAYRLYRDAGVPAPRTAYARIYLTVPGKYTRQYLGLYSIVENVDQHFIVDRFGTKQGAMFKPVTPSLFADLGNDWANYQQIYDAKTKVTPAQTQRVIDFARLLAHADDATFAAQLPDYFDIDQLARYMAVTTYLSTLDSILCVGQNNYLYLDPKTNKFQFLPWDLDHAFGQIFGEPDRLARLSIHTPWVGPNRFLQRVYQVESFKKAYLAHLAEFSRTIFKPERFHAQVNEIAAAIRPAIEAESRDKLSKFDATLAGSSIKPASGWFAPKPVKSIKGFVDVRTPEVLAQLEGKSKGEIVKGSGFERSNGRFGKAVVKSFMAKMQPDANGQVSRKEFCAQFTRWFAACDLDNDGTISHAELEKGIVKTVPMPVLIPQSKPATAPR